MSEPLDFTTLEKSPKPNCWLVAPEGLCQKAEPDASAPVYTTEPEALFLAVRSVIDRDPQYREPTLYEADLALHVVAVTKVFRFKDDMDVKVLPTDGGATLAIYSRSRLGYSDLGKNEKRVEGFLAAVREELTLAEGRITGGRPEPLDG